MSRRRFKRSIYLGILKRQRNLCACGCGEKLSAAETYQFDHEIPLWAGGKDEPENLQALRWPCHVAKSTRETTERAKADRIRAKREGKLGPRGGRIRKQKIPSRPFDKRLKKKLTGEVVAR